MVRFVVAITIISITAALVLGVTYNITKPLIAAQQEKEKVRALTNVLPDVNGFRESLLDGIRYYEGYKDMKRVGRYAFLVDVDGYAGKIEMLVGVDEKGKIQGVEILSQAETPGLGARCTQIKYREKEPWFLRQFKGLSSSNLDLEHIEAITGATITTEAIVKGLKEPIQIFLEKMKAEN